MPWPRHVLQSVMVPVVTQTRVSDDYSPSNEQWIVGDSTILAFAVGLAAFKDVSVKEGCSKQHTCLHVEVVGTGLKCHFIAFIHSSI